MYGYIDGVDFLEMEAQKYYAPPASWSDEKKKDNARTKIYSGEWLGAEKCDGYFAKLIKDEDGNIFLCSRSRGVNGQFAEKHEWVPHLNPMFEALPNGTCLLGEVYFPSTPGSKNVTTILGCLKEKAIARQEKGEKLNFYAFDCLAADGKSLLKMPFAARIDVLRGFSKIFQAAQYVQIAEYKTGMALWTMLQEILDRDDEGIVITHSEALYEPGKRPSKTTLKIKKELKHTIDCFFTGAATSPTKQYTGKEIETWPYWENQIDGSKHEGQLYRAYATGAPILPVTKGWFYTWYGSLEIAVLKKKKGSRCKINGVIYEDTEVYPIGYLSGLTEEVKADPHAVAFKPIEVTAMEFDRITHTLRHGKMVCWRPDLTISDCTFDKILG